MQRKPRAGANRTITHSHTYYTCEITTFSKLNTYTVLYKYLKYERINISLISVLLTDMIHAFLFYKFNKKHTGISGS